jgi:CubicO group peptidase (beta-lactamase class C family)
MSFINISMTPLALVLALLGSPSYAEIDEKALGKDRGYPAAPLIEQASQDEYIVWSNSGGYERFLQHRNIKAGSPSSLTRSASPVTVAYEFRGAKYTLKDYLERRRATSLLIMKDGVIHHEHYQYDRNERHRFNSASMGKSVLGLLVGLAIDDGTINSIDDLVVSYLPELKGTNFEKIKIKDLLTMSSGLAWSEGNASGGQYRQMLQVMDQKGGMDVILNFKNQNITADPGTTYLYSSFDSELLGRVLSSAVKKNISAYLEEKMWKPMGAEADAVWYTDRKGVERTNCCIGAVTRDYARLGGLVANLGQWNGKQIVPQAWLKEMTTLHSPHLAQVAIDREPRMGYGYHIWLMKPNQVAFRGHRGQVIYVDISKKIVMVQTAVYGPSPNASTNFPELNALWEGVVNSLAE